MIPKLSESSKITLTRFGVRSGSPILWAEHASRGAFIRRDHLRAISETILAMKERLVPERLLVIDAPPRHGKSEFCSKYLPSWHVGTYPNERVILGSYGSDLSKGFGRAARDLIAEHGRDSFMTHPEIDPNHHAGHDWKLKNRTGGMYSVGKEGAITGRGCGLLIIDDPIKNNENAMSEAFREGLWSWYQSTALTRLEPGGIAVIIQTRWHRDDLAGRILRASESGDGPPARHLHFPALAEEADPLGREPGEPLWPERFSREDLERIRHGLSSYWWQALYCGRPSQSDRSQWPEGYFDGIWIDRAPPVECSVVVVDPSLGKAAKSGDYSAIIWAGRAKTRDGYKVVVDCDLERRPPGQIARDTVAIAASRRANRIGYEANGFQSMMGNEILAALDAARLPHMPLLGIQNSINKELRIVDWLDPYLRNHDILFIDSPGSRLCVEQLRDFPHADHDDGPDALQMALELLRDLCFDLQTGT